MKIDRHHDVRWMSVLSRDGRTFYLDCTLPRQVQILNEFIDPAEPLIDHEEAEFGGLKAGLRYPRAHRLLGIPAERLWFERRFRERWKEAWTEWNAWCNGELSRLERREVHNPPPDADVRESHERGELESTL